MPLASVADQLNFTGTAELVAWLSIDIDWVTALITGGVVSLGFGRVRGSESGSGVGFDGEAADRVRLVDVLRRRPARTAARSPCSRSRCPTSSGSTGRPGRSRLRGSRGCPVTAPVESLSVAAAALGLFHILKPGRTLMPIATGLPVASATLIIVARRPCRRRVGFEKSGCEPDDPVVRGVGPLGRVRLRL